MSLYDADCLAGRYTGAAPSQKSDAGHNVLDCGVELSGDGFRLSEGGDSACIPRCVYSAMYSGVRLCNARKVNTSILYVMRHGTGSQ